MRRALAIVTSLATTCAGSLILFASPAAADPSAADWYALRMCESTNRYNINTGNGYYGAYQFDLSTWRSVGGTGYPHEASPEEQDYRALRLYRMRGWEPWTCARMVGLQEDSDAGSRVLPPAPGNQSSGSGSGASEGGSAAPAPTPAPARQVRRRTRVASSERATTPNR
jgi:resuscitation-promoting factor RpfA